MPKTKVTISLHPDVLKAVDLEIGNGHNESRSAVIESVLRQWTAQLEWTEMERQVEEYYRTIKTTDREEDRKWVEGVGRQLPAVWEDRPPSRTIPAAGKSTMSSSRRKKTQGRQS